jgi:hypothetical protein
LPRFAALRDELRGKLDRVPGAMVDAAQAVKSNSAGGQKSK